MTALNTSEALWITAPEMVDFAPGAVMTGPNTLRVQTLYSGISRGTEQLVFKGNVPQGEHDTMRAPFQEGVFSFPVKYGYSAVGRIETGVRQGETVFALFPHQRRFALESAALIPVPADVPAARAVLAANMETALNITWDAAIGIGDRVVVVGGGVVGALVAYLAARVAGTSVTLVDINPARQKLATAFGCAFALPQGALSDADVVIHTSATAAGLATAIQAAGVEAVVIEASWYGNQSVPAPLGGRFHQRRLKLVSSQVGRIPAVRAARWTYQRRLSQALSLLADPVLDDLISGETSFDNLATEYAGILRNPHTLCHRVRYD
ncbi:zinc-dependent alcohol dehydrogenase [Epibacterium ulvae]|uniref:zinc-dependent alcohol dehydrogenase n=1 Tax=Epibacterium ulvae TaxID=1156985 RepID=UPI00248F901E|nr:zinc-binding alcohol dehydrogenase [Epibacterium ulvae]